ncbi:MAG: hypothetical protein A3E78_14560 [Alphaproteobacteria bacterium RIFCSPHIGHO2_12_FULL_63_12]|nr:MAG: hypothetical protein A3E78_14560 [Alphaproteobacteria bacterium RIFCSPHIGHO2_12_FULL_63_12]
MRLLLASLAIFWLAACSGAHKGADNQPAPVENAADANDAPAPAVDEGGGASIEEMRAQSLAEIDQEACAAAGGAVRQEGMLGMYRCVKPFADAGKACRSKSDCEGKCLATDDAAPDAEVTGACQADDSPFGCYAEVEGGKVQAAICVD